MCLLNTEPSPVVRLDRIKSGWLPNAVPPISPISMMPFLIAPPDPPFEPIFFRDPIGLKGNLVSDLPSFGGWTDGHHTYHSPGDVRDYSAKRVHKALTTSRYMIDPNYRRRTYNQLLDAMSPSKLKIKLDQNSLDANLVPELFHGHARILANRLRRATHHDRELYEARAAAKLLRLQNGISSGVHSGKENIKVRGGMTGSGTVYGLNVSSVHIALSDSFSVAFNVPWRWP